MDAVIYDGSFQGFLSAIYTIYELKLAPESITVHTVTPALFQNIVSVNTDQKKAARVELAMKKKISQDFFTVLLNIFYAEIEGGEMLLYRVIKKIVKSKSSIEHNSADTDVHKILLLHKQFQKEVHRMHAFTRFSKYGEDFYIAKIEPDFNMIPLIGKFFIERFTDQAWLILDVKRKKGLFYDKEIVSIVSFDFLHSLNLYKDHINGENKLPDDNEFHILWKTYFSSVNISERKNLRLQKNHMPKRYWKYLSELN